MSAATAITARAIAAALSAAANAAAATANTPLLQWHEAWNKPATASSASETHAIKTVPEPLTQHTSSHAGIMLLRAPSGLTRASHCDAAPAQRTT